MAYFPDGQKPSLPTPSRSVTPAAMSRLARQGAGNGPSPSTAFSDAVLTRARAATPALAQNMPKGFTTGARTDPNGRGPVAKVAVATRASGDFVPRGVGFAPAGFPAGGGRPT